MRIFSTSAREASAVANLIVLEVLKCFDAIPLIYNDQIEALKNINDQANSESSTSLQKILDYKSVIKYVGGYVVKKLLQKRGLGEEEKDFLNTCLINTNSLYEVSETFVRILMSFEETFRSCRTPKKVDVSSAIECVASPIIQNHIKSIAGEKYDERTCTSIMQRVAMLYYKIRGHRFASKILNEKFT